MDIEIKKILTKSYDFNADSRDSDAITDWKLSELHNYMNHFTEFDNSQILDLGAGSGIYAQYFQNSGAKLKCIDLSEAMVELCRKKNLDVELMDFYDLSFEDDSFDGIWSMNTLLHVPKASIDIVLEGIKRVLKPEGILYIGLYGGDSFEGIFEDDRYRPKRYFSRYTDEEIMEVLKRHFEIIDFEHIVVGIEGYWYQSFVLKKKRI